MLRRNNLFSVGYLLHILTEKNHKKKHKRHLYVSEKVVIFKQIKF